MKIGLLVNSIEQLDNWQLRVIDEIYNNPKFEVVLLVKEVYKKHWRLSSSVSNFSANTELSGLAGVLLKSQLHIENKHLFKRINDSTKNTVNAYLPDINTFHFKSLQQNEEPGYSEEVTHELKNLQLDLIINLGVDSLENELLTIAQHGIWELVFKDYFNGFCGPVGFWEVLKKRPVIESSLVKLGATFQENTLLGTAFFNRHWSMTETATIVSEGSVSLVLKKLNRLEQGELVIVADSKNQILENNTPTLLNALGYLCSFYFDFFNKLFEKLMVKVFKRRYECWTIFTGSQGFFEQITSSSIPLHMPKDEFWADPFLFSYNQKEYLFFENYSYKTKRGKISCGILENGQLSEIGDVLEFNFHLSFPFIFEEDGEIFLMPESSENKKLQVFKALEFPYKWELYSTAFEGEAVGDAFFHIDEEQQKWLFVNKQAAKTAPMNSELFIYKVDSIKFNSLIPHQQNPVIIDARVARNGGSIFKHNNQWYRPSQRNIDGVYGRALNINRIDKLTIDEYVETTVQIIEPDFDKKLMGLHHLHECNGKFVFDAAYRYRY